MELIADRYATPRRVCREFANPGEWLIDSSKLRMMKILGCDEKYHRGIASDYELLAEWERVLPQCEGTGAAALYVQECEALGCSPLWSAKEKWSRFHPPTDQEIPLMNDGLMMHLFVSNFIRSRSGMSASYPELLQALLGEIHALQSTEIHLVLRLPDLAFCRPDPYKTEQAFRSFACGEKYKKEQEIILLCGTLIALLKAFPKEKNPVLHLFAEHTYEGTFGCLDYLREHRLFDGACFVGIFLDTAVSAYTDFCNRSGVVPELVLTVSDFAKGLPDRLERLFRTYPRGAISFGGVLTDSPLYGVPHRILQGILHGK